ncbi:tetratricopeptide repeat protein [Rhodobacteraceae bacterium nBUS_22]
MTFNDIGQQKVKNTDIHAFDLVIDGAANREVRSEPSSKTENYERELGAIAVLPFENQSNDPEQDYFVDGITDDIIANLSLWRTFPVISRNSSFAFKEKSVAANEVAQELGARYVVQGSIRKGGQRVRITAQLVDAEKDRQLWSERWDRSLEDIFDVQDEVAAAVAAQVNPALQDYEFERIERDRPTNLNAWELYLKALHTFNERTHADHKDLGVAHAKQMCEQVISLDKKMSHAYSLMADIYFAELGQFLTDDSATPLQKIYDYAKVASDLDPKNSVAANLIASHFFFSGKFDQSKLYAERAVKLNPSFPEALYRLGQSLVHSGQYADAEEYYHKAIALSPLDPNSNVYKNGLFFANLGQNNFEAALNYNDECRLQFPTVGTYKGFNAATLGHLERGDEAKLALEEYLVLRPNLKKKSDYKRIFVPNSTLADVLIEGLIKAGWEPQDE